MVGSSATLRGQKVANVAALAAQQPGILNQSYVLDLAMHNECSQSNHIHDFAPLFLQGMVGEERNHSVGEEVTQLLSEVQPVVAVLLDRRALA